MKTTKQEEPTLEEYYQANTLITEEAKRRGYETLTKWYRHSYKDEAAAKALEEVQNWAVKTVLERRR